MGVAYFTHPSSAVGNLTIENGIDEANWAYNLNTQTYPTYGGEVVQILSVYIDDLTLGGSCATYSQMEAIFAYFAAYMQIATQGQTTTIDVTTGASYNLQPMSFTYPERNWSFSIYPKSVPGFGYGWDSVFSVWQLTAHIIDTGNELTSIKNAIKDAAITSQLSSLTGLNDEISPNSGDPETDPFQTYDEGAEKAVATLGSYADYYTSLVSGYQNGNFNSITGGLGSSPTTTTTTKTSKAKTVKGSSNGNNPRGVSISG